MQTFYIHNNCGLGKQSIYVSYFMSYLQYASRIIDYSALIACRCLWWLCHYFCTILQHRHTIKRLLSRPPPPPPQISSCPSMPPSPWPLLWLPSPLWIIATQPMCKLRWIWTPIHVLMAEPLTSMIPVYAFFYSVCLITFVRVCNTHKIIISRV